MTTADLDREAEARVRAGGAEPAFKGYRGFPATLCTSVNSQVVHGIPSRKTVLRDGDIVSIDIGVRLNGFYGDCAATFAVGTVSGDAQRLMRVTLESLERGIGQVRVGGRVSDIGYAVQSHVEAHGFSVVREFVGHGVGASLHEEPQVPNYGPRGRGPRLLEGMVLAIEPMVNAGRPAVRVLEDGWTAVTQGRLAVGALRAHRGGDGGGADGADAIAGDAPAAGGDRCASRRRVLSERAGRSGASRRACPERTAWARGRESKGWPSEARSRSAGWCWSCCPAGW